MHQVAPKTRQFSLPDGADYTEVKCKGRIPLPNRMNGKVPKGGGVIFNPKIYVAYFEPLYRDFFGGFV